MVHEASHLHSCCCNGLRCSRAFMGTAHFLLTSGLFLIALLTILEKDRALWSSSQHIKS